MQTPAVVRADNQHRDNLLERFQVRYGFDISKAVQRALDAHAAEADVGRPLGDRCIQQPSD